MSLQIAIAVKMVDMDILECLVSFARSNNQIAFNNLYEQFYADAEHFEMQRAFHLIRKAFDMEKKENK